MGRKGDPKTGGRQKGSFNKNRSEVARILEEKGFDLIQETIDLFHRTKQEEYTGGVAAQCLKLLAPMVYPQLKQIDVAVTQLRKIEVEVHDGRIYRIGPSEASGALDGKI